MRIVLRCIKRGKGKKVAGKWSVPYSQETRSGESLPNASGELFRKDSGIYIRGDERSESRDATGEFGPVAANGLPDEFFYTAERRGRQHHLPDTGHVLTVIVPD
jgi:hypothetical protein